MIFAVLSLLVAGELQAGVVVGGTRFIFPADRESISILLTNTSQESWLINSKINRPTRWAGGKRRQCQHYYWPLRHLFS
ncbi:putative chaperone [Shigella flexneri 2930-71]|nr:hypothetical protein SFK671_1120 [Shigella flexneri K-671]EGJ97928.1 putative chaperone [Shigella flexneri 2930-71]EIQ12222.1 putative chaperone [Shigella flexneri 2850-71]EIQ16300.1 putative chaperone [Shigella flexneri K-1770]